VPVREPVLKAMPTLTINGMAVDVPQGTTILNAAKEVGVEIPHYCYHPKLSIAGNCRMCLVEVEKFPKLQTACSTVVTDGMVVRTDTEKVRKAVTSVLELILIHHPIDCPICDQAGECGLQNYYMKFGLHKSRYALEDKVHKKKVQDIGGQIVLDAERCILCSRCVRFLTEVTGTRELDFFSRGDHSEISIFPGKPLANDYTGNLADICPVGALTSKDFRFKCRVWFLKAFDSICTGCSKGCNVDAHYKGDILYRLKPRWNDAVNQAWMCDFGRLTYKAMNEARLLTPFVREEGARKVAAWGSLLPDVAFRLKAASDRGGPDRVAVIASPQSSNEELYLLRRLAAGRAEPRLHPPGRGGRLRRRLPDPGGQEPEQPRRATPRDPRRRGVRRAGVQDRRRRDRRPPRLRQRRRGPFGGGDGGAAGQGPVRRPGGDERGAGLEGGDRRPAVGLRRRAGRDLHQPCRPRAAVPVRIPREGEGEEPGRDPRGAGEPDGSRLDVRRRGVGLPCDRRERGALRGNELRLDRHVRAGTQGMTGPLFDIAVAVARIAVFFAFCFGLVVVMTWVERKGAAYIQDRRGPNRADIFGVRAWGLFHPLADALKFLFKEDFIPDNAHRLFYQLAPMFSLAPVILAIAVIPFGPDVTVMGRRIALQIADLNVGILYLFAVSGMTVYGVVLAGWASGSKYPLLGGLRSSAQMLSYEVSMGLSLIGTFMVFESVRMSQIVAGQGGLLFGILPKWGVLVQPLGFILFLVAQYAEANRTPFDLPEGESELVAGYHTEYGSFKFSMFMMAEYLHMVVGAAVVATLFFGGWQVPYLGDAGFLFPGGSAVAVPPALVLLLRIGAFVSKVLFFAWLYVWVRWTIPRFRYDQVMRLGWKVMLPLSLLNIFVTGLILLLLEK